jgi:NAD(P)-dependent dehydrogenase (short-subunit alcohol dehydrogenase family)
VTGGGAPDDGIGNGRAAAILLARSDAKVLVVDIVRKAAEQTVAMIEKAGGTAMSFVADVTDERQCRALVDAAVKQWGRLDLLDNNVGIGALRPRGLTAYSTSKGAVIALTRAMAVDHGPQGIRVNCVAPGPIYTPRMYTGQMSPAGREARRKASVLGIEGLGWDIGNAVRFLLSEQARYITGQTLVVDGGATLVGPSRTPG